jgi:signal peptidase I
MIKLIRDLIAALIFSILFALVFRTWFFAPYMVPTSSMVETIQAGDHVFVNKHAYGYHLPFLEKTLVRKSVQRGDIVAFSYHLNPRVDYIKRVIGVPGDKVKIEGEMVFVNGESEPTEFLYYDPAMLPLPENMEVEVPEEKLWVMGDNRRNSKDSRYWGVVDVERVEGKVIMIFWSHDPEKPLTEGYNTDRIGIFLN